MIQRIAETDISRCCALIRDSFHTVADEFGITAENAPRYVAFATTEERLIREFHEGRLMYGYFQQGELVGYCSLHLLEDGRCELNNLCVSPAFRHRGFRESLLANAIRDAGERGCTQINIGIVEENVQLKKWYESFGFVHTGTLKIDFFPFTCGYMERRL